MRKRINLIYFLVFLSCVALMIIFIDISPGRLLTNVSVPDEISSEQSELIRQNYEIGYDKRTRPVKTANLYMPVYRQTSEEAAAEYADAFGFSAPAIDNGDEYLFIEESKTLNIAKYLCLVSYTNKDESGSKQYDENEIVRAASDFISRHVTGSAPALKAAEHTDEKYILKFCEKLDGIVLDDLPAIVEITDEGVITRLDASYYAYEKIASCELYTSDECVYFLPYIGEKVRLTAARLCYVFRDSIIQPAYRFDGVTVSGASFTEYVKAAKYK